MTVWRKGFFAAFLPLGLSGCIALDTEEEVRVELAGYVFLEKTRQFVSRPTCTAAVFEVISEGVRSQRVKQVDDVRHGLRLVREGRVVAFDLPGLTPDGVSQALMSISLSDGMGLVSSFTGPANACMDDHMQLDFYFALMDPETLTIYAAQTNALMLLHKPSQLLFFLRGNV